MVTYRRTLPRSQNLTPCLAQNSAIAYLSQELTAGNAQFCAIRRCENHARSVTHTKCAPSRAEPHALSRTKFRYCLPFTGIDSRQCVILCDTALREPADSGHRCRGGYHPPAIRSRLSFADTHCTKIMFYAVIAHEPTHIRGLCAVCAFECRGGYHPPVI